MKKRFLPLLLSILMPISAVFCACSSDNGETSANVSSEIVSDSIESSDTIIESSGETDDESSNNETSEDEVIKNEPIVRPEGYPTLCGSFMQPYAFAGYSVDKMKQHLQHMYNVGIDMLILQWSFETKGDKVISAYYESSFEDADKSSSFDESGKMLLDTILQAAEEVGFKVFIGLNDNEEWWEKGVFFKDWLTDQAELGIKGAQQIYDTYKSKYPNAFYGWYFVFEFYNMQVNAAQLDNATYLLNSFRNGLCEIDSEMPMMLSPFISSQGADPEATGDLWEAVFAKTDFRPGDIFCCQDSVGAGHIVMDQLDDYYREIKEAVDTKEGLKFWANNEDFTQSENYSTAPLNRFVEQMNISDKYVEAHVTFAYSHYQHPDMGKTGCHLAYQKYYETGKIPETTLPAPEAEYTAEDNGAVVNISGKISNPDKTVMGIDISKNGETIKYIDLTSKYGNAEFDFTFKDTNVSENGTLKYKIRGIDYYGNKGPAFEFSVNFEGKDGGNVAEGKKYQTILAADTSYPDEGGKSLTDGKLGYPIFADPAWVGFLGTPSFVIDLGTLEKNIYAVEVNTLGGGSAGVFAPTAIALEISDDGKNFTKVITQNFDADPGPDDSKVFLRSILLDQNVSARYVKITVSTNQSWIFIDEISVYAE